MNRDELLISVLRRLLEVGYFHAMPAVRRASKTLSKSMSRVIVSVSKGALYIPHYWAVFRHDGRLNVPVFPKNGTYMVWFRNPKDDPRHRGIFPERASQIRRLTVEEFVYWSERNKEAIAAGQPPPMIVTRAVYKPTRPTDFFLNDGGGGMAGFAEKANQAVGPLVARGLIEEIPGIGRPIRDSVVIRL